MRRRRRRSRRRSQQVIWFMKTPHITTNGGQAQEQRNSVLPGLLKYLHVKQEE